MKTRRESRDRLLNWYDQNQRDLPWRGTSDAYAIWVSEIMLQQTRVETVLPYFERFLHRYPNVEALAEAEEEEVLGLWSGLGYYRRARLLHSAARQVASGGGEMPRDLRGLRELPGVGTYTAAAIGSIAFGLDEPAIDGNVERVISRYRGIAADPKSIEARKQIVQEARGLLDEGRPGDSNQALMELGATLCRPRTPLCSSCPLVPGCYASSSGDPEAFPAARVRPAQTRVERQLAVVGEKGRILLFRRPSTSEVLAGMWELPWAEGRDLAVREGQLEDRYGGRWSLRESLGRIKHTITHRAFDIQVYAAEMKMEAELAERQEAGWFAPRDLDGLPISSLVRKAVTLVRRGSGVLAGGE